MGWAALAGGLFLSPATHPPFALIIGIRGADVRVPTPKGPLAIVPFMVLRIRTPMGMLPASEGTVWFGLATPAKAKGQGV